MKKLLLFCFLATSFANVGYAQLGHVYVTLDNGTVLDFYNGSAGCYLCNVDVLVGDTLVIPDTVTDNYGYKHVVEGIGSLNSSSVHRIFSDANAPQLRAVVMPSTITEIGSQAFMGCTGLTEVTIPVNVQKIRNGAFMGCTGLTTVYMEAEHMVDDYSPLIFTGCSNLTTAIFAEGVKVAKGFRGCSALDSVVLPSTLRKIGSSVFEGCTSLTSITLPEGVDSIDYWAFYGCTALESIDIPGTVSIINGNAFEGCSAMLQVILHEGLSVIKYEAFQNCTSLQSVVIPEGVIEIGNSCFKACSSLQTVTLPASLLAQEGIEAQAFMSCISLETVSVPIGFTKVPGGCFRGCSSLQNIQLSDEPAYICQYAFLGCTNLEIVLPNGSTVEGTSAFMNVKKLYYCGTASGSPWGALELVPCYTEDSIIYRDSTRTVVTGADANIVNAQLPLSVKIIGYAAFKNCNYLNNINLPSGITSIAGMAFQNCTSLDSLVVPATVRYIGAAAFNSCYGLQSITLPDSLETIEENTFAGCSQLDSLYLPSLLTKLGKSALYGCSSLQQLVLPDGLLEIGEKCFGNCTSLDNLTVPASVLRVGSMPFFGCTSLDTVYWNAVHPVYSSTKNTLLTATNGDGGMFSMSSVSAVVLGDSVEVLPKLFFYGMSGLEQLIHLSLPSSVRRIEDDVFGGCTQMLDAVIHENIDTVGTSIFLDCTNLKKVEWNARHAVTATPFYYPDRNIRLYTCGALSYCNTASNRKTIVMSQHLPRYDTIIIGNEVKTLPDCAFGFVWDYYRYNLDSIDYLCTTKVINNSQHLRHIGTAAFGNLRFESFDFGDSLLTIGVGAFKDNYELRSVMLPDGLLSIGDAAFKNCVQLDSVSLPQSVEWLGTDCFCNNTSLSYLYYDCASAYIGSFVLDEVSYGDTPFGSTPSLKSINFGPHVRHLFDGTFKNTEALEVVVLPDSLESIGDECFALRYEASSSGGNTGVISGSSGYNASMVHQRSLHKVVIPSSVWYIGEKAFQYEPLDTVLCLANYPPYVNSDPFGSETYGNALLVVPCGSANLYSEDYYGYWNRFEMMEELLPYNLQLTVNVDSMGTAEWVCDDNGVVLTASPAASHRFLRWSDGVEDNPRTVTLTGDTLFEAQFTWGVLYNVAVTTADASRGTVTGSGTFVQESTDTLTATSLYGYHFTSWNDGDTSNPRPVLITRDSSFTAIFGKNNYSIALSVDSNIHGNVTGAGTFEYLDEEIITATANYGYHFTQWNDGVIDNPRTIVLTKDTSFTAIFGKNNYTVSVQSNNNTLGTTTGSTVCDYLDTVSITAVTLAEHYHFLQWSDGNSENPRQIIVNGDTTLTAIFVLDTHHVSVVSNNAAYGTVIGTGDYSYGTIVTLRANPASGYYFVRWSNGSSANPTTITCVGDSTVTAYFTPVVTPELCMVSVQDDRNVLMWNLEDKPIVSYTVYRESNVSGHYEVIAVIPYADAGEFTDTASRPENRSYRYRMTATDTCGNESQPGGVHKTMHLTISRGVGNKWNLVWTPYEGAEYNTYVIYRGTSASDIQQIDIMPSAGNTTYTDNTAPDGEVYYQVGVIMETQCSPIITSPAAKNTSISLSNIASSTHSGGNESIADIAGVKYNIYAYDGRIIVEGAESATIQIFNIMGQQVNNQELPSGIYLVKIDSLPARKVVMIR